jgi:endonuclease/exonuclease/phosphatase family metal-dependent hydrolase
MKKCSDDEEVYDLSSLVSKDSKSIDKMIFAQDPEQKILVKQSGDLRIMTYNVHGFKTKNFKKSFDQIIGIIGQIDPDVLALEEVYIYRPNETCTQQQLRQMLKQHKLHHGIFSRCGINAVFSKFPFDCSEIDLGKDYVKKIPRNALVCTFPNLIVVGTHLDVFDESGSLRKQQIKKILDRLRSDDLDVLENKQIVITGDFNSLRRSDYTDMEWEELARIDHKRGVTTIVDAVHVLEKSGFKDSFDSCGTSIKVSVWSNRRVDYIFGKNVRFSQTSEHRVTLSDHYPVYADISL